MKWRVQYTEPDGKRHTQAPFDTKRKAESWDAQNSVDMEAGSWVSPKKRKTRVNDLWPKFEASKAILEPSTTAKLEQSWPLHVEPKWGDYPVGRIRKQEVQAWLAEYRDQAVIGSRAFGVLAGILDIAVEERCLPRNEIRGVKSRRNPTLNSCTSPWNNSPS